MFGWFTRSKETAKQPDYPTRDLTARTLQVRADTVDLDSRTVEAVLATEAPVVVFDMSSGRAIEEVLRMDGADFPNQVPLLDTHMRFDLEDMRGSVRNIRVEGDNLVGTLHIADTGEGTKEERAWQMIRDGHLTDVSVGYTRVAGRDIAPGETEEVAGREYTAGERTLRVLTGWRVKETSLVPIGADAGAKMRQEASASVDEGCEGCRKGAEDGRRGEVLAAELDEIISDLASASRPRNQIVFSMAGAADMGVEEVNQVLLADLDCPTKEQLEGFAIVLDVSVDRLIAAAEQDGCEYAADDDGGDDMSED